MLLFGKELKEWKHCGTRRKMLVSSMLSFSLNVFKNCPLMFMTPLEGLVQPMLNNSTTADKDPEIDGLWKHCGKGIKCWQFIIPTMFSTLSNCICIIPATFKLFFFWETLPVWKSIRFNHLVKNQRFNPFPKSPCFYVSAVQVFSKHCSKMGKLLATNNFFFPTVFSTCCRTFHHFHRI